MHIMEQPFVFVSDMVFNLTTNLVTLVAVVCVVVLAYRRHPRGLAMPVAAAVLPWLICLVLAPVGALNFLAPQLQLILLALVYGIGSMVMTLAYIQVMAYQKPSKVLSYIALGAVLTIPLTWLLLVAGTVVGVVLNIVLMILSVVCLRLAQRVVGAGGSVTGVAAAGATAATAGAAAATATAATTTTATVRAATATSDRIGLAALMLRTPALPSLESLVEKDAQWLVHIPLRERCRKAFLTISDTLIAVCILEAVVGLLNTFMLGGEHFFSDSEWVVSISFAIAAAIFAVFVLIPLRIPSTASVFKRLFVVLPVLLMLLPFLDTQFGKAVNIVLLVGYDSVLFLATYTIITTAHRSGLSSHLLMGAFMGAMRLCLLGSLLLGYWFGANSRGEDNAWYILIVFIAIYLLSMVLVFFSRSRKGAAHEPESQQPEPQQPKSDAGATFEDSHAQTCEELARRFGLTSREKEVLAYLGRGRSSAHIGKTLMLSPNTVRAHVRSIYSKLGVHTRQELIDLFDEEAEARVEAR
jgi:DNA-binding CsgD family transcriptional regulator